MLPKECGLGCMLDFFNRVEPCTVLLFLAAAAAAFAGWPGPTPAMVETQLQLTLLQLNTPGDVTLCTAAFLCC
jgi:hypothetical protein